MNTVKSISSDNSNLEFLSCTCDDTVCVELRNTITLADHHRFMEVTKQTIETHGYLNLLFYYAPSFKGWEQDAADDNMKAILDFGRKTRRLAYVNPPEKKIMQHKVAPDLFGGEMKYFSDNQLQEAMAWVSAK